MEPRVLENDDANGVLRHPAVHRAIVTSERKCANRRKRILADPTIASILTQPPLSYPQPEMWNGFIPPATLANGQLNTSPRRDALTRMMRMLAIVEGDVVSIGEAS